MENEALEKLISHINPPFTLLLDMKKTIKHWLLDHTFLVVRKDCNFQDIILNDPKTRKQWFFEGDYNEAKTVVLNSIKNNWELDFAVSDIELLAWTDDVTDTNVFLFTVFDDNNLNKGVYAHSTGRSVGEIIFVIEQLEDFFDFEKALYELTSTTKKDSEYRMPRKKISKTKKMAYTDLLSKDEYLILDAELGCKASFDFYKQYIDTVIIPLTKNELKYDGLNLISDSSGKLTLNWEMNKKAITFILDNASDYIDGQELYKKINEVLAWKKSSKKIIPFRQNDFGQEYGLAYLDTKKTKKLSELFDIELI